MIFSSIVFFFSLLGIAGLFVVKHLEEHRQVFISPELRKKADERAIQIKTLLLVKRAEAAKLPGILLHLAHVATHTAALEAARLARFLEAQAHRLADFVSHKHHFQKRETRSEFLKQVSEHSIRDSRSNEAGNNGNGNVSGIDVTHQL